MHGYKSVDGLLSFPKTTPCFGATQRRQTRVCSHNVRLFYCRSIISHTLAPSTLVFRFQHVSIGSPFDVANCASVSSTPGSNGEGLTRTLHFYDEERCSVSSA